MALDIDEVINKIENGDYTPDSETIMLIRLSLRGNMPPGCKPPIWEFYESQEYGWRLFAVDAIAATGLAQHPHGYEAFEFARSMLHDPSDMVRCLGILRRVSRLMVVREVAQPYPQVTFSCNRRL